MSNIFVITNTLVLHSSIKKINYVILTQIDSIMYHHKHLLRDFSSYHCVNKNLQHYLNAFIYLLYMSLD